MPTNERRSDCLDPCRNNGPAGRNHRHASYKLSCDEFEALLLRADGKCEICRYSGDSDWPLVIDHDSDFDRSAVRGLLCWECNARFDQPSIAGPRRDQYLVNAWYLTAPGRPAPVRIRHATMNTRSLYLLGHAMAADAIEGLLVGKLDAPSEHDERELRERLRQLVRNHRNASTRG
jgi:hypothetical protein